jgi:hypothetical protein
MCRANSQAETPQRLSDHVISQCFISRRSNVNFNISAKVTITVNVKVNAYFNFSA